MKITGEARLLIVMGLFVLLGGGGMVLVNRTPAFTPTPPPTPAPLQWTAETFKPLVDGAKHVRGATKNPVLTIVEFGDFECPSCRHAYNSLMTKLDKEIPIRFVFHHFPLEQHHQAMAAAVATEAAARQGKFWPMFDAMYSDEKAALSPAMFSRLAEKIGLNMVQYNKDLADPGLAAAVDADKNLGAEIHIFQTPTFIVKDEKTGRISQVVGATDLDHLVSMITRNPPILAPASPAPSPP